VESEERKRNPRPAREGKRIEINVKTRPLWPQKIVKTVCDREPIVNRGRENKNKNYLTSSGGMKGWFERLAQTVVNPLAVA
jgi:hypothetical protein